MLDIVLFENKLLYLQRNKVYRLSNPGTMLISMEEYYEGGHSVCRNPVIQKMFVFLGIGEKGGTGADVIAKGWKDNG